jgi:hypothetical protein
MADAAVVVEEAVEVMCKLKQGEDYLGNIVLESGNEGLRCRFAWTARVEEVAASFDAHRKGVTCRGDPEVSSCLEFATPNLHAPVNCWYCLLVLSHALASMKRLLFESLTSVKRFFFGFCGGQVMGLDPGCCPVVI